MNVSINIFVIAQPQHNMRQVLGEKISGNFFSLHLQACLVKICIPESWRVWTLHLYCCLGLLIKINLYSRQNKCRDLCSAEQLGSHNRWQDQSQSRGKLSADYCLSVNSGSLAENTFLKEAIRSCTDCKSQGPCSRAVIFGIVPLPDSYELT